MSASAFIYLLFQEIGFCPRASVHIQQTTYTVKCTGTRGQSRKSIVRKSITKYAIVKFKSFDSVAWKAERYFYGKLN